MHACAHTHVHTHTHTHMHPHTHSSLETFAVDVIFPLSVNDLSEVDPFMFNPNVVSSGPPSSTMYDTLANP